MGFGEHLEAVTDAEHPAALVGVALDRFHGWGEAGDGPRAQVIAVGKAARQDDEVVALYVRLGVPDYIRLLAQHFAHRVEGVLVAVRARENDYSYFHFVWSPLPIAYCLLRIGYLRLYHVRGGVPRVLSSFRAPYQQHCFGKENSLSLVILSEAKNQVGRDNALNLGMVPLIVILRFAQNDTSVLGCCC